jgi:hypothetical protein
MAQPLNANQGKSGYSPLDARALIAAAKIKVSNECAASAVQDFRSGLATALRCLDSGISTNWKRGLWTFRTDARHRAFLLTFKDRHGLPDEACGQILAQLQDAGFHVTVVRDCLNTWIAELPQEAA